MATFLGLTALTSCSEEYAEAPIVKPFEEIGDGTWQKPLQTWQAHLGTMPEDRTSNWVTGYIVGYINSDISTSMKAAVISDGETPATLNNNILLAQIPYDKDKWEEIGYTIEDCVPVQLPSGVCRSMVNLSDYPSNFNRQVSLRGTTGSKYMGAYGLRSCYEYNWGDSGLYEAPAVAIEGEYFCNFSESHDLSYYTERGWSQYMQRGGLSGFSISESSGEICSVGMSAYYGNANGGPYINWIISPELNLDKVEQKIVSFRTKVSYQAPGTTFEVFVLTHKNPISCEPVELECPVSATDNKWMESGDIDLSEFSGKIYIGFRYMAEKGGKNNSSNYDMTDFNFGGANPSDWIPDDKDMIGLYRKVDRPESGKKYAMVFDEEYAAIPASRAISYGRMDVVKVEFINDDYTEFNLSRKDAFTFINVEEDYWMIEDYWGRLIYMDDDETHGTFQFSSRKNFSELECSWKLTEKNEAFVMVSYFRNYHLEFNPNFMNVAPNSGNYIKDNCAMLYELVEE